MSELASDRQKALDLFKQEKGYFELLEKADDEINNLVENCNGDQRLALLYLLFFISKKEIPILGSAVSKMNRTHFNILKNAISKRFKDILEDDGEEYKIVQAFSSIFPYLVIPILHKEHK